MQRLITIFLLFLCHTSFASEPVIVKSCSGVVYWRDRTMRTWHTATANLTLPNAAGVRTAERSRAVLRTSHGIDFSLPENAELETYELTPFSRDDLVLELTALRLQTLPEKKENQPQETSSFVLHGALSDTSDPLASLEYRQRQLNGLFALYKQGFFAGFILKYYQFKLVFPDFKNKELSQALLEALKTMNMPTRYERLLQENEK